MDCLNDRLNKKDLGAFYTPMPYCKKAAELGPDSNGIPGITNGSYRGRQVVETISKIEMSEGSRYGRQTNKI